MKKLIPLFILILSLFTGLIGLSQAYAGNIFLDKGESFTIGENVIHCEANNSSIQLNPGRYHFYTNQINHYLDITLAGSNNYKIRSSWRSNYTMSCVMNVCTSNLGNGEIYIQTQDSFILPDSYYNALAERR